MVELGQHTPDEQIINGVDRSVSEWPVVEVIVERNREETIRIVEEGSCEVLAHSSIHYPNWEIVVRWIERTAKPAIRPTLILAGSIALGAGVYKLSRDPIVEGITARMMEKLKRKHSSPP